MASLPIGNLFSKIFLTFWLAMALIAAAIVLASAYLARGAIETGFEQQQLVETLADEAENALEQRGAPGLRNWLEEAQRREKIDIYVLDEHELELLGRELPEELARMAARMNRIRMQGRPRRSSREDGRGGPWRGGPPPGFERFPERAGFVARWIGAPELGGYRLLADLPAVTRDVLRSPAAMAMRLAFAVLVSGLMSFFLARYMTSPIRNLRQATRRFTDGDLGVRVGAALGERKDEIADLARDFDLMAERLGSTLSSQQRMLRDMSHELRSPLARLQVALELARQRSGGAAAGELDRIEIESERLNALIGEILSLVRLESAAPPEMEDVDLAEIVSSITDDAAFEAGSTNRELRVDLPEALPLRGNAELLRRAMENVVRNAVLHTPEGTTVEIEARAGEPDDDRIVLRVRDHGRGVAPGSLPHLFEPFFREADSRGRYPTGFGVGLAIAARAVRVHGGEIGARNATDGGLVVEIRLPAA